MKKFYLLLLTLTLMQILHAQRNQLLKPVNYEAANWKLRLVSDPNQIIMMPVPTAEATRTELATMKRSKKSLNKKQMQEIQYWDAGAPAYRWNQVAPALISPQKFDILLRTPTAWVNLAIYDATILAWKEKVKYKRKRPHEVDASIKTLVAPPLTFSFPCEHTVTAAAAAYVLGYFFPEKADSILQLARNASQSRIDAGVQFPSDVEAGWKIGEQVAKIVIEKAKNDGSATEYSGPINKDPKKWTGQFAMGIKLTHFQTISLRSGDQFLPPPPPDFENEMKELKALKQNFKTASLAYYWANNGGYDYWSELAAQKMFEYRMSDDAPAVARIYTVIHTAYHDAAIAIFTAKYKYWGPRPVQYDSSFKSLLMVPPFPGYPSGHAAGSSTTCTILEQFFPADASYFQQLAKDCAESRFYAGIHFKSDNEAGLVLGKNIGTWVFRDFMDQEQIGRSIIKTK